MKKIILIVLSILLVAAIAVAAVFIFKPKKKETPPKQEVVQIKEGDIRNIYSYLCCSTAKEIESYAKVYKLNLLPLDGAYVSENLSYKNFNIEVFFRMNDKKVEDMSAYFTFKEEIPDNTSADKVKGYVDEFVNVCSEFFGVEIFESDYGIYASEGYQLNNDEDETYKSLLKGKAAFAINAREENCIWLVKGRIEEKTLVFDFLRSTDLKLYENVSPDITIEGNGFDGYVE